MLIRVDSHGSPSHKITILGSGLRYLYYALRLRHQGIYLFVFHFICAFSIKFTNCTFSILFLLITCQKSLLPASNLPNHFTFSCSRKNCLVHFSVRNIKLWTFARDYIPAALRVSQHVCLMPTFPPPGRHIHVVVFLQFVAHISARSIFSSVAVSLRIKLTLIARSISELRISRLPV